MAIHAPARRRLPQLGRRNKLAHQLQGQLRLWAVVEVAPLLLLLQLLPMLLLLLDQQLLLQLTLVLGTTGLVPVWQPRRGHHLVDQPAQGLLPMQGEV